MGDRKTKKTPVEHAVSLLQMMLTAAPELRDEVFIQICKQTRLNPSFESTERGWRLLLLCLATFPPSEELGLHLIAYCVSCLQGTSQVGMLSCLGFVVKAFNRRCDEITF